MTDQDSTTSTSNNDQRICPFTYQPLPNNPGDVAYIFDSVKALDPVPTKHEGSPTTVFHCGHQCSLVPLMEYLHRRTSSTSNKLMCPVCQESPIVAVADGGWVKATTNTTTEDRDEPSATNIFSIKYGKLSLGLSINTRSAHSKRSLLWGGSSSEFELAQTRICNVLNLEPTTLKILYKGKIIYPNIKLSDIELSKRIISTSNHGSSILTVMGTQKQDFAAIVSSKYENAPWYVPTTIQNVVFIPFHFLQWLIMLGYYFIKSIFITPPHSSRRQD